MINPLKYISFVLFLFVLTQNTLAKTEHQYNSAELVNIAGLQRMLSQKIVKSYLFYGLNIRPEYTHQQLIDSVLLFDTHYQILLNHSNEEIQDLLLFVEMIKNELLPFSQAPYSKENAGIMLEFSETLLEASNEIVERIEKQSQLKINQTINLSGRQRMLTQRIAKFYIAYQAGFTQKQTVRELNQPLWTSSP